MRRRGVRLETASAQCARLILSNQSAPASLHVQFDVHGAAVMPISIFACENGQGRPQLLLPSLSTECTSKYEPPKLQLDIQSASVGSFSTPAFKHPKPKTNQATQDLAGCLCYCKEAHVWTRVSQAIGPPQRSRYAMRMLGSLCNERASKNKHPLRPKTKGKIFCSHSSLLASVYSQSSSSKS